MAETGGGSTAGGRHRKLDSMHGFARSSRRDRTAGTGGRSSFVVVRCPGDHGAATYPAKAGLWRVGCRARRDWATGAWPPGSGTGAQPLPGRGLVRQPVRRGGPGRSTRSGSRPGSPARSGRGAWSLPRTGACGSEPARGLADGRLGPNGLTRRDVGP